MKRPDCPRSAYNIKPSEVLVSNSTSFVGGRALTLKVRGGHAKVTSVFGFMVDILNTKILFSEKLGDMPPAPLLRGPCLHLKLLLLCFKICFAAGFSS